MPMSYIQYTSCHDLLWTRLKTSWYMNPGGWVGDLKSVRYKGFLGGGKIVMGTMSSFDTVFLHLDIQKEKRSKFAAQIQIQRAVTS